MVPFFDLTRQHGQLCQEIESGLRGVFERGRFILGEEVSRFEEAFAHYVGVRYAVGVSSGTDALCLALKVLGIREGDKVITVAHSFVASALAISLVGGRPLFVDIDPYTYTMDPNRLEAFLKHEERKGTTKKIKAIIPVHLYGHPADMDGILEIAGRYDLAVIEDACQAHGAKIGTKKVGTFGTLACFSFYPTKNLGAYGDGGMVVTQSRKLAERLRLFRCYGERKKYEHVLLGGNHRLDEIQGMILRIKLNYLDQWIDQRRNHAQFYTERLSRTGLVCPVEAPGMRHVYHLYVVRTRKRNGLQTFLGQRKIGTLVHYPTPIHLQKAYKDLGYRRGLLPVTEKVAQQVLSLPLFPELRPSELEEVVDGVQSFFERCH
jgi:dTDP-4-amino-4,6-dideoxygalactose transaminase